MVSQVQALCRILDKKDLSLITNNNLTEDFFFNTKAEYNFIKQHYEMYKTVPDKVTFLSMFPDFTYTEVREPDNFIVEQLIQDYKTNYMAYLFNQVKKDLESGKPINAEQAIKNAAEKLSKITTGIQCTDLIKDTSRYDRYLEKSVQKNKYYISTGFPELDQKLSRTDKNNTGVNEGGIDMLEENMVIIARTGVGKCLAKGTEVLMADGTKKKVEDVQIGDKVQSYNCINTVQALHNGISNGYKIIPNKGEPFTVSANHILTLLKYNEVYDKDRRIMTTNGTYTLIDMFIEDFIKLSQHKKHYYKLFRPAIEYDTKEQSIDPYILGAWLGDGVSSQNQICSADSEILEAIKQYCLLEGFECHNMASQDKKAKDLKLYSLCGRNINGKYFKELLRENGLLNNKHIPLNYLTGDKHQRLALLAGLLDTDGCYMHYAKNNKTTSMFDFTNKNKILFDNVAQLARGLGFKVCIAKPKQVMSKVLNEMQTYYRMNISGDLHLIPTKVARKQAAETKHQNPLVTGFKVEPVDRVEYYGFMADGDHRYLLADNTLTHNTQVLLKMAAEAWLEGKRVGIYEGEMTADKVGYRIDTFISHIQNSSINRGDLFVQQRYKAYIDSLKATEHAPIKVLTPNDVPGGEVTVDTLKAFIEKENLEILFVDQYDLLEEHTYVKAEHERVGLIAKKIKQLQVEKQIPIISVCQMNRTKNEDGEQDTTQVAGSDKISRYATTIIALEQKNPDFENHTIELTLNIIKARDGGDHNKLKYTTDFNTGRFNYIPVSGDGVTSSEDQQNLADSYAPVSSGTITNPDSVFN